MDESRRLLGPEPLQRPLFPLRPALVLGLDPERVDAHPAGEGAPVIEPFLIMIPADRVRRDLSLEPGLFVGLPLGGLMRLAAGHRPALRDDPAPGVPRRDQKNLDPTIRIDAKRQGRDLLERLDGCLLEQLLQARPLGCRFQC